MIIKDNGSVIVIGNHSKWALGVKVGKGVEGGWQVRFSGSTRAKQSKGEMPFNIADYLQHIEAFFGKPSFLRAEPLQQCPWVDGSPEYKYCK